MRTRSQSWTVGELLAWTTRRFGEVGIDAPRVDAEHLLAQALACRRMDLYLQHDRLLKEGERAPFRELVRRRLNREPVAYIAGARGFHAIDLELAVDRRVLIPRPETEHLVDWILEWLPPRPAPVMHLLDVGTGSGSIALAVKRARDDTTVTACERSPDALEVARTNAERTGLEIALVRSDLLADIEPPAGGFRVIAANLPYIPTEDLQGLQPEVRDHEPLVALDGGRDGLAVIRRLVEELRERDIFLARRGRLFLEVGIGQAEAVACLLAAAGLVEISTRRDLAGIERVVSGERSG